MEIVGIILAIIILCCMISSWSTKKKREALFEKYRDAKVVDDIMEGKIWQGMSHDQLIDSWGRPVDTSQKVQRNRVTLICKYGQTGKNRFNSRVTLENGEVIGWDQK